MAKIGNSATLERQPAEKRIIRVSDKRQITIPQKYFQELGFEKDAICYIDGDSIVIKPIARSGREFSEFILEDLIKEGFEGEALLDEFIRRQAQVRPAIETMIDDAELAAQNPENYTSVENLFAGNSK
ncbi:MAG: AbrB/MazE/SpoVT family DNA-binding domain-containing protein [Coriobacteriia bacterium]|nr:AbrB/MazE/SpoVT family DNA-binding domain-containing protein [Coriobacteriia bacterium]MCL2605673.1 AbrB/MazE/SpoVT family DNA-binding domain-containing protein [Coriobacteriia bacterium]